MSAEAESRDTQPGGTPPEGTPSKRARLPKPSSWRIGTIGAFIACGVLFIVSAQSSHGTDLRPGRYTDMASLVREENAHYQGLQSRVQSLNDDIAALTGQVNSKRVEQAKDKLEALKSPAGFSEVRGPGVTVTLSDAPADVINNTTRNLNLLVVHQQDIQAVVNAMWAGGASAITVQGQRVISTTGIKCEGNAVQLHGVPYSQPYVISAVGEVDDLTNSILHDDYLEVYRADAALPDISVGWDLRIDDQVVAPAYDGLTDLTYAKPIRSS